MYRLRDVSDIHEMLGNNPQFFSDFKEAYFETRTRLGCQHQDRQDWNCGKENDEILRAAVRENRNERNCVRNDRCEQKSWTTS